MGSLSIAALSPDAAIATEDLTQANVDGTGVFDVLMRSVKAHLDAEYQSNRIRGPEYSQVYLGSLQAVLQTATSFLLQKQKTGLEAQLLEQQIAVAKIEVDKANAQLLQIQAQTALVNAQKSLADAQTAQAGQQTALYAQQVLNLKDELLTNSANRDSITQQTSLYRQKIVTEQAQTQGGVASDDSVIGKQKNLYTQQANGFTRDAEQKAAQILVDSWKVRRTTDEGTVADGNNQLADVNIGRAVNKLLAGVQA